MVMDGAGVGNYCSRGAGNISNLTTELLGGEVILSERAMCYFQVQNYHKNPDRDG
jgi:hypothetical protein